MKTIYINIIIYALVVSLTSSLPNKNGQWAPNLGGMLGKSRGTETTTKDASKTKARKSQEREQLYEAYNLLHSLAQVNEMSRKFVCVVKC